MGHHYLFATAVALLAAAPALAQNIALNKPVSIVSGLGSIFTPAPSPSVVTDGLFLAEATPYGSAAAVTGALRWNPSIAGASTIEISLGSLYTIDGIIVQADDNDSLEVSYLGSDNLFHPLYAVSAVSVGFGFVTRPSNDQTTWAGLAPVDTTTIRVTTLGGDGFYGISELQLRGVAVPSAAPVSVLAASGLLTMRRRRAR